MDRVRAAIFSSLGDRVPDARVLDLFAGSGSMGIEALSRGSESAVFVDENERCVRCIRENLRMAQVEGTVQTMDAYRFLDQYAEEASFDLIFADPPYSKKQGDTDHSAMLSSSLKLAAALKPDGLFVLERQSRGPVLVDSAFEILRCKRYGGSEVLYLVRK
jgi:16S rRNA (guanine966-N2)-methyltransferase